MNNRLYEKMVAITEMAFDPGAADKLVHPEWVKWIEAGGGELKELLPELSDTEQSYLEMITSDSYQSMVSRMEKATGLEIDELSVPGFTSLLMQALKKVQAIESKYPVELSQLAVKVVLELPEFEMFAEAYKNGEVKLDVRLVTEFPALKKVEAKDEDLTDDEQMNVDLFGVLDGVDEERLRRRLANLIIQGNAVIKTSLYHLVAKELEAFDSTLPTLYGVLAVGAELGYWVMPPEAIKQAGAQSAVGSAEVEPEGEIYVIHAHAAAFPFIVHELVKGIYEWISIDPSTAAEKHDVLAKEPEDLMVGPGVVKTINSYVSTADQKYLPLLQKRIQELSRDSIRAILAQGNEGHKLMADLLAQVKKEWADYEEDSRAASAEEFGESVVEGEFDDTFKTPSTEDHWGKLGTKNPDGSYTTDKFTFHPEQKPEYPILSHVYDENIFVVEKLDAIPLQAKDAGHVVAELEKMGVEWIQFVQLEQVPLKNRSLSSQLQAVGKYGDLGIIYEMNIETGWYMTWIGPFSEIQTAKGKSRYARSKALDRIRNEIEKQSSKTEKFGESVIEGREKDLKIKYVDSKQIPEEIFVKFVEGDPTSQKKYLAWMLKQYIADPSRPEHMVDVIQLFYSELNTIEQKDVNAYKSVEELDKVAVAAAETKSKSQTKKEVKSEGAKLIYDKDGVKVYEITTWEAAKLYGSGTKWCISGRSGSHWRRYFGAKGANIYFVISDAGKKYAIVNYQGGQREVFDAKDNYIDYDMMKKRLGLQ